MRNVSRDYMYKLMKEWIDNSLDFMSGDENIIRFDCGMWTFELCKWGTVIAHGSNQKLKCCDHIFSKMFAELSVKVLGK